MQMARFNFKSTTLENCILYTINSTEMTFWYQEHIYLYLTHKLCFEQQTAQTHEQKCVSCIRLLWEEKLTCFQ